jgi:hypothetical protein
MTKVMKNMLKAGLGQMNKDTSTNSKEMAFPEVINNKIRSVFGNAGWRTIDGTKYYFRSKWEYNYACYLQFLKEHRHIQTWEHECHTFWFLEIKRGVRSYLPDFIVVENDGSYHWVEVKGFYDPKSLTKINRFKKYYPQEELRLVDKKWFSKNSKKLSGLIKGWEK